MCGRYKLSTPGDELWEHFDLHGEQLPLVPRFNIAPTQQIAVVRSPHTLELIRWGLPLTNPKAGGFNVRVESLAAPIYREAIRQRRCLILADGFYEWRAEGKRKQPFLLQRSDRQPFAFAGIWAEQALASGELLPSAAILTTAPRGVAAQVHDRMPVILPAEFQNRWLDPNARYKELLVPDSDALELVPVSSLVNSAKNDDARVIEPITLSS
ncbi:MAG TPA: SOS response-associated peptidase [Polyangiaceae bacterium]|nr:SOS response-associated peptidase [Polyangiaceae bacterium]